MQTIKLSNAGEAIVDDADFSFLSRWKWARHKDGYAYRTIRRSGKTCKQYMHRLLINPPAGEQVDHINRNGLDNRRANLRSVPAWKNQHNRSMRINTRGSRGVTKPAGRNRWIARIYIKRIRIHLGTFATKAEAEAAYRSAAIRYQTNGIASA